MASQVRNNQVSKILQSSTNGGQFAHRDTAASTVTLSQPIQGPPGMEHIPDPAPGQTLIDGSPAPATFAEAWQQYFKPVNDFEKQLGRTVDRSYVEELRHLKAGVGIDGLNFGEDSEMDVEHERFGSVMRVTIPEFSLRTPCDHPETAGSTQCHQIHCGCGHCIGAYAINLPNHLATTEGSDDDGLYQLEVEFRIPDEVLVEARELAKKVQPLDDRTIQRELYASQPWKILTAVDVEHAHETPEVMELQEPLNAAMAEASKYRGVYPSGVADYTAAKNGDPIAREVYEIENSLSVFAKKPKKRGFDPIADQQRTIAHYKGVYETHEETVASIAATEKQLGAPLPEAIVKPALDKNEFGHRKYYYGVLLGTKRRVEILTAKREANDVLNNLSAKEDAVRKQMQNQREFGAGWPEGAYNAPDRDEWAELTGIPRGTPFTFSANSN